MFCCVTCYTIKCFKLIPIVLLCMQILWGHVAWEITLNICTLWSEPCDMQLLNQKEKKNVLDNTELICF